MARLSEHRSPPWIALMAGAVVLLVLVLIWGAWLSRRGADRALRAAAEASADLPALKRPTLPDAPRLPYAPKPSPR